MPLNLEDYMLPCLNKKLFGVECFGCGFQRSFLNLIQGNFVEAFHLYPAIYTILLMLVFALLQWKFKFSFGKKTIIFLAIINAVIIVGSYFIKMHS